MLDGAGDARRDVQLRGDRLLGQLGDDLEEVADDKTSFNVAEADTRRN
ncbi:MULTISPECIES: hypothetical protein [Streptomyces]|uniref:CsbD family protein n=1 Tax=Streptomyces griseocarneus TaxID=51201 RepID=A0ABX7RJY6_9ACTN|nr:MULTISPECIES: hypothetical protein [Streptomyces]QSY48530.1 hypothetical protein J3S04_26080 [Streptomyces griseocarneus]